VTNHRDRVDDNPERDDDRLADDVLRRPKEPSSLLGPTTKGVLTEGAVVLGPSHERRLKRLTDSLSQGDLYRRSGVIPEHWLRRVLHGEDSGNRWHVNEHLMRALLYVGLFFATCTEEQCELDTAVKRLEGLTAELNMLSAADRAEFRAFMSREAAAHPIAAMSAEISEFAEATFSEED
jgi:hypothetical protein